jgi:hypothetical protein
MILQIVERLWRLLDMASSQYVHVRLSGLLTSKTERMMLNSRMSIKRQHCNTHCELNVDDYGEK